MRLERLADLTPETLAEITRRGQEDLEEVRPSVEAILNSVRTRGDAALREITEALDQAQLQDLAVPSHAMAEALDQIPRALRRSLELMVTHLERVSRAQRPREVRVLVRPGLLVRRVFTPIDRVGVYAPGGTAPLFSSLLMAAVPARVAGCREIIACSPPQPDGSIMPVLLAAAHMAGVSAFFRLGGAQAVAAMAFGTESVPRVDKIVGPGNRFVTAAKLAVYPYVEIDLPAGPSECIVIADASARAEAVAAELLAQAEHGVDSPALLLTPSRELALQVQRLVDAEAVRLTRAPQIAASLARWGRILLTDTLEQAVAFTNAFAPEHVQVSSADPRAVASGIRQAGSIFVGAHSPVAAGDYACGSNHILPTGGRARAASGVSLETFGKWTQVQELSGLGLRAIAPAIAAVAEAEGLSAHAAAVTARLEASAPDPGPAFPPTRSALERFAPYEWEPSTQALARQFGLPPARVLRFDMNTVPETPALWARTVRKMAGEAFQEYDDAAYTGLVTRLAAYTGVEPEQITVGAGADEILDLCAKVFVDPGARVVIPSPTYSMFAVVTAILDGETVAVPRRKDFRLDVEAVVEAGRSAAAVFLCNPNNPTGTLTPLDEIVAIAGQVPGAVVVDEAYYEFGRVSAIDLIARFPNVVVVRTFSKAFALASARVGYAVAHPAVAQSLKQVRPPTSVSRASVRLAEAALDDRAAMTRRVRRLERHREDLAMGLKGLGLTVIPSHANFLLVRARGARALAQRLLRQGLVARTFAEGSPLSDYLRLTVRTPQGHRRLLEAIRRA
jgi:histidinol dehydrogenase